MSRAGQLSCKCGETRLTVEGRPILSVECGCKSCQVAGAKLQAQGSRVLEPTGATRYVLYRKDRISFVSGAEHLKEFRLEASSKTRRALAACCGTPVFLEFQGGHWLSLFGGLWTENDLPPLEMRSMTMDLPAGTTLSMDVPNARKHTASFVLKLMAAWAAMGFRSPTISVAGELHV